MKRTSSKRAKVRIESKVLDRRSKRIGGSCPCSRQTLALPVLSWFGGLLAFPHCCCCACLLAFLLLAVLPRFSSFHSCFSLLLPPSSSFPLFLCSSTAAFFAFSSFATACAAAFSSFAFFSCLFKRLSRFLLPFLPFFPFLSSAAAFSSSLFLAFLPPFCSYVPVLGVLEEFLWSAAFPARTLSFTLLVLVLVVVAQIFSPVL